MDVVTFHDADWLDINRMSDDGEVWDRIPITGACDIMPTKLFKTLRQGEVLVLFQLVQMEVPQLSV